jgi:hypothetical protein
MKEITIGGKNYPVTLNMGAMARIATALGVKKFAELQTRLTEFNLPDMPLVIAALLKSNGHEVSAEAIDGMDPVQYFDQVMPAIFPKKAEADEADANPPTSPAPTT